jgi:Tol biopolymer transport system component
MEADGTQAERLTQSRHAEFVRWAPTGDRIAFASRTSSDAADIFVVELPTGVVRQLTEKAGNNTFPSFSPDCSEIAFLSSRDGRSEIWRMRSDGSSPTRITTGGGYSWPTWSPYLE